MRVSQEFDFFSLVEDKKIRVRVFDSFFTAVLKSNASAPHKPPADYNEVTELACMSLRRFGYAGLKPLETTFFMAQSTEYAKQVARTNQGDRPDKTPRLQPVNPKQVPKKQQRPNVVGKMPSRNEDFKMGKDIVCKQFQLERCTRESTKGGCKMGSVECVHKCATIKSVRSDGTLRLCGLHHAHKNCPDKV